MVWILPPKLAIASLDGALLRTFPSRVSLGHRDLRVWKPLAS
jgi:hypothetical protein